MEEYIIYLNYYSVKDLADIRPDGGTYIHSASEAFEEEQEFDFVRLSNWLNHYNIEIVGFEMKYDKMLGRPRLFFVGNYHASGHLTADELLRMVDRIDPDYVIPVHTLNPAWFYDHLDGRVKRLEEWGGVGVIVEDCQEYCFHQRVFQKLRGKYRAECRACHQFQKMFEKYV